MGKRRYIRSEAADRFAAEMANAQDNVKNLSLFSRRHTLRVTPDQGELCLLRRWNSHTPCLENEYGGGYLLRWRDRGTVVDPGYTFIRLLKEYTDYALDDIHMVIATHDHADHCHDLGPLISLFRQYNRWRKPRGLPARTWDLLLSHGVAHEFAPLLHNPENKDALCWETVIPPKTVPRIRTPFELSGADPPSVRQGIRNSYGYELKVLMAYHRELLHECENTAMGVRFRLLPCGKVIVISGDTGCGPIGQRAVRGRLAAQYRGANLLILHVGTMERPEEKRLREHLGLAGVVDILWRLRGAPPECVVLTEWGYEFKAHDRNYRSHFTQLVVEELRRLRCDAYYAPFDHEDPANRTPIVPADEGLRLRLPDLAPWGDSGFFPLGDLVVREESVRFSYQTRT